MTTTTGLTSELTVACEAAHAVGAYLVERLGTAQAQGYKAARDAILDVDLGAEQLLLDAIHEAFPEDAVLSEEGAPGEASAHRRWIIDPLDGSYNFQHGQSHFGPAIALQVEGETRLGVLFLPEHGELYTVIKGQGAFCNGKPIHASEVAQLSEAIVYTSDFAKTGDSADNREPLRIMGALANQAGRVRMIGTAVDDFASLARGRSDGLVMYSLHPWDIEGGKLLVEEAGGIVTRVTRLDGVDVYVGGNRHVHPPLVAIVTEHGE